MIKSKSWDWSKNESNQWLVPAMEACYLSEMWKARGLTQFLDLGCGLGRHSIYFAHKGFDVSAVDLSGYAVNHLKEWAIREKVILSAQSCDMLDLPFADNSFNCIMAYNVIYHTDTKGFIQSLDEIRRVLKPQGELFITLISKNTWSFQHDNQNLAAWKSVLVIGEGEQLAQKSELDKAVELLSAKSPRFKEKIASEGLSNTAIFKIKTSEIEYLDRSKGSGVQKIYL